MTEQNTTLIGDAVLRKLHRLRLALRFRLLAEGLAWVVLAAFAGVLVTLALDYTLRLERGVRAVVVVAAGVALAVVLVRRLLLPLTARMDIPALALLVERRNPSIGDRLISTIQLSATATGMSGQMVRRLARETEELTSGLDFSGIIERRRLFQLVSAACCSAALLAGLGIWQSDLMTRYLRRNLLLEDINWPQNTYLSVRGDDFAVLRGDDLEVVVELERRSREAPPYVTVHATYPSLGRTEQRLDREAPDARRYVMKFSRVSEPFEFYVTGGDDSRDRRNPHRVRVVPPANLEDLTMVVSYPGYTARGSKRYTGGQGMIAAPAGGSVRFGGVASKDLQSAELRVEGDRPRRIDLSVRRGDGESVPSGPRVVAGELDIPPSAGARTLTLSFELTDTEGFVSRRSQQVLCRVEPDTAPSVSLTCPPLGRNIAPQAVLPLSAEMEDDYGLTAARAAARMTGAAEPFVVETVELTDRANSRLTTGHELDLQPHDLEPGKTIRVTVEASDTLPEQQGYDGPNVGVSPSLEFTVVSPEDLLGELVRRQKELRLEFVQAIAAQTSAISNSSAAAELAAGGEVTPRVSRRLEASAHLQQNVSTECAKAAETLAGLLEQMRWNRIGSPSDLSQLRGDVVEPLESLAGPIEDILAKLSAGAKLADSDAAGEIARETAADQREVLGRMERIAEHMQKLQTRQDLARQLRMIIKMSEDISERIRSRQERDIIDIFEDDEGESDQ
ncbi:MAG: hypothetical protein ACLFVW_00860 [Phycisphaerae bacterium]